MSKPLWVWLAALAIGGAFGLGFLIGKWPFQQRGGEVEVPHHAWRLIQEYEGVIDPERGIAKVRVFSASVIPSGTFEPILSNRIVLEDARGSLEFQWPRNDEFAGQRCDIEDLDGDGRKEFVFFAGEYSARVVSYQQGKLVFRQSQIRSMDLLLSAAKGLRSIDIDQNGRIEFLTYENEPASPGATVPEYRQIPRIMVWTAATGFQHAPELQRLYDKSREP